MIVFEVDIPVSLVLGELENMGYKYYPRVVNTVAWGSLEEELEKLVEEAAAEGVDARTALYAPFQAGTGGEVELYVTDAPPSAVEEAVERAEKAWLEEDEA